MKVECMFTGKIIDVQHGDACPECDIPVDDPGFDDSHAPMEGVTKP